MKLSNLIAVLAGASVVVGVAQAQETGTLKKIKETGTITLGVRDASIPFSYMDDKQAHVGYSIDLCQKIVAAVQKQLGLSSLNVKTTLVTGATRISSVVSGTVDLECGATTNNLERQKQVAFAPTTFVSGTRLLAKKASNIASMADLKGKALVATSGSTNQKQVTALNNEKNLGINIVVAKDVAEAFQMVETGRTVAFATDDILLAALAANSKAPGDYAITKEALSVEPYGIVLRRDDPAFKKLVDDAIAGVFKSGEINRIYFKWFQSPIPPKGISLNWPLSEQLKAVFAKPTDSGDPATYTGK